MDARQSSQGRWWNRLRRRPGRAPAAPSARHPWRSVATAGLVVFLLIQLGLAWYWSREPDIFWIERQVDNQPVVLGYATTHTLIEATRTLLEKPGGYLSNDIAPPGVILDNIPNWEYGVLVQVRDLARVLRNDYSRSQSQSTADPALDKAEPEFNFSNDSWILPASETKYRLGIRHLEDYLARLQDPAQTETQFFARADNLREYLAVVEKRLGSLSQRLSASIGQERINTDLAGDPSAAAATPKADKLDIKTPWLEIDDVFYEARGTAWALVHFLRAAQFDFAQVLKDKNAEVSLRQIIRELEGSLQPMGSPVILNGSAFGIFSNHSLVMASYLSRANSAVINLRELLDQG